jgi:hypothetical protein
MDEKTLKLISLFSNYLKENNEIDNISDDLKLHIKTILNADKTDVMIIDNKKYTCEYIKYNKVYYRRELSEDNTIIWNVKNIMSNSYSEIDNPAYKNVLESLYQSINKGKDDVTNDVRKYNL